MQIAILSRKNVEPCPLSQDVPLAMNRKICYFFRWNRKSSLRTIELFLQQNADSLCWKLFLVLCRELLLDFADYPISWSRLIARSR